jgi:hypothetical protein
MANYRRVARRAARRHGLDPGVFERQIQQESGFQPHARSGAGARGIAQIMPKTAAGWGVNPDNPRQALDAAAKNMAGYVRKYGSVENALRAYNAGPGAIKASHGFSETNTYVAKILGGRHPSSKGGKGGGGGRRSSSSTTTKVTTSTPGVDNRVARAQLIQSFLSDKHSDPLAFAVEAKALRAIAPTSSSRSSTTRSSSGGGGGGGGKGADGSIHGSKVKELIFNDGGKGFGIKDGKDVDGKSFYSGVWAGHANHVHAAAGPRTIVRLGKKAQQMGLHVSENPHFGGVTPVHVAGSNHYKGEAIDASSSDKAKMRAFAKFVEHYSHSRR